MFDFKTMPTVGEWFDFWFITYKQDLAANSVRNIEQILRLHTPVWFKELPLDAVNVLTADSALSSVKAPRQRKYARQVWHSAFKKAVQVELLSRNVMENAQPVKYRKKKSEALTIEEQDAFFEAIKGDRMEQLFWFAALTGARRAEICALKWSDVNWKEELVVIRGTKTEDSYRCFPLSEELKEVLRRQAEQQKRDRGTRFECKDGRIFPYNVSYVSQVFKKYCPAHHFHELRHTFVTRCAESEISVSVCQQLVGHSTPNITLNIYTHVLDRHKRKEAAKFSLHPDSGFSSMKKDHV